ncbi:hypothetical protein BDZ89DRAFT_246127 [Hymenopellis radicata]|nr:hypothetical protein BDZ89DRAFT_246127 [Hymenopellis radicata]
MQPLSTPMPLSCRSLVTVSYGVHLDTLQPCVIVYGMLFKAFPLKSNEWTSETAGRLVLFRLIPSPSIFWTPRHRSGLRNQRHGLLWNPYTRAVPTRGTHRTVAFHSRLPR